MKKQFLCFHQLKIAASVLASLLLICLNASAHYVWIEETPDHRLVVRFAEWSAEYEVSPGHLDELSLPEAWKLDSGGKPDPFTVKKASDCFQVVGASASNSVQIETSFEVMAEGGGPARKPFFYARWQPASAGAVKPTLNFDIVPTANVGEFQVYFRAAPLAKVQVTAHLPDGKDQDLTADDNGLVHFIAEKPGLYMLSCAHQREAVKGFSGGLPYDAISHNCSLTWRQP
jgi:hypothetical protein